MYLSRVNYQNVGPLKNVNVDLPFKNNQPLPLIIVGENGSGKSLFLSNIIDSMYEIAGNIFQNVMVTNGTAGHYFYKISQNTEIQIGQPYMASYIKYTNNDKDIEYLTKLGVKNFEEWEKESGVNNCGLKWSKDSDNDKHLTQNEEILNLLFQNNICCYFSPNRYARPIWLSEHYFNIKEQNNELTFKLKNKFNKNLYNPITVENSIYDNISWLMEIILDSRLDINESVEYNPTSGQLEKNYSIPNYVNQEDFSLLKIARQNIEIILSEILGKQVFLRTNYRNSGIERIFVVDANENIVLKSLNSLSTGQMALFNIFSNIVRYADSYDLNKSIKLGEIQGIVVIDEVDLHLHSNLQYTTLPKLIKKFPKIQFIITSHSPLFILGMEKIFRVDNFQIRELPENQVILPEDFSQFYTAYNMLKESKKYREEINAIKNNSQSAKPLIITEGASDWIHIKNALTKLKEDKSISQDNRDMLNTLTIDFLEFYPKEYINKDITLQMGDSALISLCEQFSKLKQTRKYIFIADRDKPETIKKMTNKDSCYKNWGNNVFSFCIPYPKGKKHDNNLCIEHYYSEKDLKKLIVCEDCIKRRLFLGKDFDENGNSILLNRKCENIELCKNKTAIIDGSAHKRVFVYNIDKISQEEKALGINNQTNFGLSKIKFAESVSSNEQFKDTNLKHFINVFSIIKKIIED